MMSLPSYTSIVAGLPRARTTDLDWYARAEFGDRESAWLVNAVVVVIAFYFGSRATSTPPTVPPGQPAPHHPRLVRILLFLGFAGLTAWFLVHDPSLAGIPTALVAVLEVLGGYVLGATASWLVHRRAHESHVRHRLATIFRDVVAAGALGLTAYTCFALV